MLDRFALSIEKDTLEFYDQRLYDELISWVWKDGRYDHEDGKHDDLIIAGAINDFISIHMDKLEIDEEKIKEINKIALKINSQLAQENRLPKKTVLEQYKRLDKIRRYQKINNNLIIDLNELYDQPPKN